MCREQEDSRWPLVPCAAGSAGVGGGRLSPLLPRVPPADSPGFATAARACAVAVGGLAAGFCWLTLVKPPTTSHVGLTGRLAWDMREWSGSAHVSGLGGSACTELPNLLVFPASFRLCPLLQ